jgi:hypothetical protein
MRLLVAIPHYYAHGDGSHGALDAGAGPQPRVWALTQCLRGLVGVLAAGQEAWAREGDRLRPMAAGAATAVALDVVICTSGGRHLLDQLPVPPGLVEHRPTGAEPSLLGFEGHAVLASRLGQYDLYAYLEDDLVLHDPYFLRKLLWFNRQAGDAALLQPNRFEMSYTERQIKKVYIDFELAEEDARPEEQVALDYLGETVLCRRASNPHAGCFFLNSRQMAAWAARPDFLSRETGFVGPLESAATLGVARAFRVYKPAPRDAGFLEIQHYGQAWSRRLPGVRLG